MIDELLKLYNIINIIVFGIGIILTREIYLIIRKYNKKLSYVLSLLIVIAIILVTYCLLYFANPILVEQGGGLLQVAVILEYVILIILINKFKNIRHGIFLKTDRLYIAIYYILLSFVTFIIVRLGIGSTYDEGRQILILSVFIILMSYIFYRLILNLYLQNYRGKTAEELREIIESGEEYIKNVQAIDKQVRMIRHDMKNQLQTLSGLLSQKKYEEAKVFLKEYSINLEKTSNYIHTDNVIFNTIVNNKIQYCKSENIRITSGIHYKIKPMKGNDLYIIIGNILDNAIEAEIKEDEDNREINIISVWNNGDMIVKVENYISQSVFEYNKEFNTSKDNSEEHGLGIQIIKELVKKNNGKFDMYEEGDMFCVEIRW